MKLLEEKLPVTSITIMVQKEVGERLAASPGTADYGAITAAVALEGSASITRIVPRTMFTPRPNVDSCVVRIDMHDKYAGADKPLVKKLIKAAFAMRRKTLVNNLCSALNLSRSAAEQLLASCGYDVRIRGEKPDLQQEKIDPNAEEIRAHKSRLHKLEAALTKLTGETFECTKEEIFPSFEMFETGTAGAEAASAAGKTDAVKTDGDAGKTDAAKTDGDAGKTDAAEEGKRDENVQ